MRLGGGGDTCESGTDVTLIRKPNMPISVFSSSLCVY